MLEQTVKAAQYSESHFPALFRMELSAVHCPSVDKGRHHLAILGGEADILLICVGTKGVDKVDIVPLFEPLGQRAGVVDMQAVPAHMGNFQGSGPQMLHRPGNQPQPPGLLKFKAMEFILIQIAKLEFCIS